MLPNVTEHVIQEPYITIEDFCRKIQAAIEEYDKHLTSGICEICLKNFGEMSTNTSIKFTEHKKGQLTSLPELQKPSASSVIQLKSR